MERKRAAFLTLGCKVNSYETDAMQKLFEDAGYETVAFQEEADVMFNSALIYELAILKQYAEPALFGMDRDCPEYIEAKKILKFLDYFIGVSSEEVPKNSILREFVGGSCFNVG